VLELTVTPNNMNHDEYFQDRRKPY